MSKHIGIVASSTEGVAVCYHTICLEGAELVGKHSLPEISMHTFPLSDYMNYITVGDWNGVANLMLTSAGKVAKCGADFIVCPDNTIHEAYDLVVEKSDLPWLHIAAGVGAEAVRRGYKCLGILGTRYLMEGPVYPSKLKALGIAHEIPEEEERNRISDIIFNELVYGLLTVTSRAYFSRVISRLERKGCDAVVLGSSEIPLIVQQEDSRLPVLDSTRLLAREAVKRAFEMDDQE